ncbi:MAG: histidinol-phosphate aminotransferase family protein [Cyclobacteriaceae bacterium]|nr:histidinol-phosphate aminotransferase family protein [Cyclobacteriaceae bacterium]
MTNHLSRRNWLRTSALAAGSLVGLSVLDKPAFGMKPFKGSYSLREDFFPPVANEIKARLSANENPWGPSKKAIAAIVESAAKGNRYVYNSSREMEELLAKKEGVTPENILLSAGSTDILEKVAFALCMKGGNVVSADPSYLSLVKTATSIGATWKNIPLTSDYAHDVDAMASAIDGETKIVYICNPNNPTGTLSPIDKLKNFCKQVSSKTPVFVDEAYLELLDNPESQTTVGLVSEGYDIIVCRTFSKIHGMAGLRVGYMVANPERIKMIKKLVRTEMALSVTSLAGALASLADTEFQNFTRNNIKINREFTFKALQKAGAAPIPSYTNFILFPIQMPSKEFTEKMAEKGVGVRGFEISGKSYGRVSIGTLDEMKLFVSTFNAVS